MCTNIIYFQNDLKELVDPEKKELKQLKIFGLCL